MSSESNVSSFATLLERLLEDENFDRATFIAESESNQSSVDILDGLLEVFEPEAAVSQEILEKSWQAVLHMQRRDRIRESWLNGKENLSEWFVQTCRRAETMELSDLAQDPPTVMARLLAVSSHLSFARTTANPTSSPDPGQDAILEMEVWLRQEAEQILRSADALFTPVPPRIVERYLAVISQEVRFRDSALEGCFVTDGTVGGVVINTAPRYNPARRCYTWAHEIGHHVLHRDRPGEFRDNKHTLSETGVGVEAEANVFASSLLMPQSLLIPSYYKPSVRPTLTNVHAITAGFKVSPLAAMYRLVRMTECACVLQVYERGILSWSVQSPAFSGRILAKGAMPPVGSVTRRFVNMKTDSQEGYHVDSTPAEGWLREGNYSYADESAFRVTPHLTYALLTFHD